MKKILQQTSPTLFQFLEDKHGIYNVVDYKKLGLKVEEEFQDPITYNVMNYPVILNGCNFDFDTLDILDFQEDGETRLDPFNRQPFRLTDLIPNEELYLKIRMSITNELYERKKVIREICRASVNGDLDKLKELFAINKKIKANDSYQDGYSALHYACKQKQLDIAKYLVELGAELYIKAGTNNITPILLLQKHDNVMAEKLKNHLVEHLQHKMSAGDATAYVRYAKLILNGIVPVKKRFEIINLLDLAGKQGDVNGYILCGDIYLLGLYGAVINYDVALKYYAKAIDEYSNLDAKIKHAIVHIMSCKKTMLIGDSIVKAANLDLLQINLDEVAVLANSFNKEALFLYSLMFQSGLDVSQSHYKQIKYLEHSANLDFSIAQVEYALLLCKGEFAAEDLTKAVQYLQLAAQKDYSPALYMFGAVCRSGDGGLERDPCLGLKFIKLASDRYHAPAQIDYASCLVRGEDIAQNTELGLGILKSAADNGDPEAQYIYAKCYKNGRYIDPDRKKADYYIKLSADQGYSKAQCEYGSWLMQEEIPTTHQQKMAAYYSKLAADQDEPVAQNNYAICCFYGLGIEKNRIEAMKYLELASDNGYAPAQIFYASCLITGVGAVQNIAKGISYYKLAAEQGDLHAQTLYAYCCCMDKYDIQQISNYTTTYLKSAADRGDPELQYMYALCCENGYGVSIDPNESLKYYRLSAAQGYFVATSKLEKLINRSGMAENSLENKQLLQIMLQRLTNKQRLNDLVQCKIYDNVIHYRMIDDRYDEILSELFAAVVNNDITKLLMIIKTYPLLHPDSIVKNGMTALHFACSKGHKEAAIWLIERGCNLYKTMHLEPYKRPIDFCDGELAIVLNERSKEYNAKFDIGVNEKDESLNIIARIPIAIHPTINWLYNITGEKFKLYGRIAASGVVLDAVLEMNTERLDDTIDMSLADIGLPFVRTTTSNGNKRCLVVVDIDVYFSLVKGYILYKQLVPDEKNRNDEHINNSDSTEDLKLSNEFYKENIKNLNAKARFFL